MADTTFHISPLEMKAAVLKIPAAPEIFVKLGRLLKDKDSEMEDVIRLVEKDPALVARVCRLSNTAYFNTGEPIGSLEEGINRIGFQELHRVVGVASIASVFKIWNVAYKVSGDAVWQNALAVGIAMEQLAAANGEDRSEAYTTGILKSLGKLVIDNCAKTHKTPPVYDLGTEIPVLMWEQDVFGSTNPQMADYVLDSWSFPERQLIGVRYQYQPELAPDGSRFAWMLNLAGGIAEKIGAPLPGETSYWSEGESCVNEAGITSNQLKSATGAASEKLKALLKAMED
ncbi:MAG: HDOD domain-containing protein [Verrucomicrobiota bacterium]